MLTGKYFKDAILKANDHRNGYFGQFDAEKVKSFLTAIQPIADAKNASLSQLVLRWTTLQPGITIVLAGARDASQAVDNAKAMEIVFKRDEMDYINEQLNKISF
ncbi:Aldo/keto reductase family protein [compost metagenome]